MRQFISKNLSSLSFALAILILLGIFATILMDTTEAYENTTQTHKRQKFIS